MMWTTTLSLSFSFLWFIAQLAPSPSPTPSHTSICSFYTLYASFCIAFYWALNERTNIKTYTTYRKSKTEQESKNKNKQGSLLFSFLPFIFSNIEGESYSYLHRKATYLHRPRTFKLFKNISTLHLFNFFHSLSFSFSHLSLISFHCCIATQFYTDSTHHQIFYKTLLPSVSKNSIFIS